MSFSVQGVLHGIGNRLNGWLPANGRIGNFLMAEGSDSFKRAAKEAASGNPGFWTRMVNKLPKFIQPIGHKAIALERSFNKLPGISKIKSGFLRSWYFFDAAIGAFVAAKDTVVGFTKTKGGMFDKLIGGLKSGFKSALKTVGTLAATVGTAITLPGLLGIASISSPAGIVVGLLGGMVVGGITRKAFNTFLPIHSHTEKSKKEDIYDLDKNYPLDMNTNNPIIHHMDYRFKNRKQFNEYLDDNSPNPFLRGLF